jgi:hypothetical protein
MRALINLGLLRPVLATLGLIAAYLGFQFWLIAGGARKLTEDEMPAPNAKAHYEVVVNFPPEAFHITRMQDIGRVIEVKGNSVFLMDLKGDDARELARNYWIADLKRWKGL